MSQPKLIGDDGDSRQQRVAQHVLDDDRASGQPFKVAVRT